jgi:hypothetical protein
MAHAPRTLAQGAKPTPQQQTHDPDHPNAVSFDFFDLVLLLFLLPCFSFEALVCYV